MWNPIRAYFERNQKEKEAAAEFLRRRDITSKLLPSSAICLGEGIVEAAVQLENRQRVYLATGDSLQGGSKVNIVVVRMKELELEGYKWIHCYLGPQGLYAVEMEKT